MRIRQCVRKRSNGTKVLKLKAGHNSFRATVIDLLQECRRILQQNDMEIPEWFDFEARLQTGHFTKEGQFAGKGVTVVASKATNTDKIGEKTCEVIEKFKTENYENDLIGVNDEETFVNQVEEKIADEVFYGYEDVLKTEDFDQPNRKNSITINFDQGYYSDNEEIQSTNGKSESIFGLGDLHQKIMHQKIESFEPWFMDNDNTSNVGHGPYSMLNNQKDAFDFGVIGSKTKENTEKKNEKEDFANEWYSHWESKIWKSPVEITRYL